MQLNNPELIRSYETGYEKGHGRLENRSISVLSVHNTSLPIDGINQIAIITRERNIINNSEKYSNQSTPYITNALDSEMSAEEMLKIIRTHWDVENKLHYPKDFVFGEDRSTIRAKNGPMNMAALRNFAVSFYNICKVDNIKRCVDNVRSMGAVMFCEKVFAVV